MGPSLFPSNDRVCSASSTGANPKMERRMLSGVIGRW